LSMWLLNDFTSARHSRRRAAQAAARTTLCAAMYLFGFALTLRAEGILVSSKLRKKDVRRAEKVVRGLRLLDEKAKAGDDPKAFRALVGKLYPGLFVTVAEMRASDLKTDLDTAAFLYEEVGRTWPAVGATVADCGRERPDTYQPLCHGLRGGTTRGLLLAKARLHVRWAEAVIKTYKGEGDTETSRALSEMKAARENDRVIAGRIAQALKTLEGVVNVPPTYADYQEHRAASKVSFGRLEGEFADALGVAAALLAWMPRDPSFYRLSSARRSYRDGMFWYRKVNQSRELVVSANGFAGDPLKDLRLEADLVGYAAVVNWRTAAKYTRLAEQSPSNAALRSRD
jgi:hypothetical protein